MVTRYRQRGLTYLWMLFLVFLLGLGLGKSLEVYSLAIKREKEAELLYIGRLYREAIKQYYLSSPGSVQKFPASLEDLRKDPRSLVTRRYLRRLYPDPITGKAFAVIAAPEGGIQGVRSTSSSTPLRLLRDEDLFVSATGGGRQYQEWQFVYGGAGSQ